MRRREFIAGLGGAVAGGAIGCAAVWTYAARALDGDQVRAPRLKILRLQAATAADKITSFIREIAGQVTWTMLLPWTAAPPPRPATLPGFTSWGDDDPQLVQHRFNAQRLLRQVPAITEIVQLDENGNERLREWKVTPMLPKFSAGDPEFVEAIGKREKVYYGPVYAFRQANHSMNVSFAGLRRDQGVSVVKLSVILIWEVVRQVKAGEHVTAYVLDAQRRVIAHSDDLNLFQHDFSSLPQVQAASVTGVVTRDNNGREVLVAYAAVATLGLRYPNWRVFVEMPAEEADALAQ